jgi:plasmid stability protein
MSKMIQVRHVPDALHKRLRARAAMAGMTLSDYLRQELERTAAQLTPKRVTCAAGGSVADHVERATRRRRSGRA